MQGKARLIQEVLDLFIPDPKVPLQHKDPFTLLVAVLLSAQCTDERVNQVTSELFKRADTPLEMSKLEQEELYLIIKPCGLGQKKAKALIDLSKILLERFMGSVPKTREDLQSLPLVGRKTASVVLAQAFNIPAFAVDTHILRSARRWGLSKSKHVEQVERDLCELFPKESWIKLHLQIILFARRYCPAKNHHLKTCPMCKKIVAETLS